MRKTLLSCLLLLPIQLVLGQANPITKEQYQADFVYFWKTIQEDYCYFDKKQTDWNKVKEIYSVQVDTVSGKRQFVLLLERAFAELYDHHASLNTNTSVSPRLVPSGTDLWAEFVKDKPVVVEVRSGFGAEKVGLRAGMEIISVNDIPVQEAVTKYMGKSLKAVDSEARNYALRMLLASNHITPRKITVQEKGKLFTFFPDNPSMQLENIKYSSKVEGQNLNGIGYIKINNCLFDNDLIPAFDSVLTSLSHTKALIMDLRETPSGGNTTVARAILGRFISKDSFYQKHELTSEEKQYGVKRSWVEIVSPRGKVYDKPVVVLAGHWTGSVGEGITIAFDGMQRATTIGAKLAGLNGAIYTYELPNTKIQFSFPVERLYHINGSPRENYTPNIIIDFVKEPTNSVDIVLQKAVTFLNKEAKRKK